MPSTNITIWCEVFGQEIHVVPGGMVADGQYRVTLSIWEYYYANVGLLS